LQWFGAPPVAHQDLRCRLNSVWDNPDCPPHHRPKTMTTTIKAADLIETIAGALQYIS